MSYSYALSLPPTSIILPGWLFQLTAPTTGSLQIAKLELQQTVVVSNQIHRFAFMPVTTPGTGSVAGSLAMLTPGAPSPGVTTLVAPINITGGVLGTNVLGYVGWNVVTAEKEKVPTPDMRIPVTAGSTLALVLLTTPPTGGFDLSGTLFFTYQPN